MTEKKSLLLAMATKYEMEVGLFAQTIKAMCLPEGATDEQFAAFLMVAREHNLNPLTKEIYAFPTRNGGIQPIVGVDGHTKIMNSHPAFNGMKFENHRNAESGTLEAITAVIYRRDREHPIEVTEYMAECVQATEPREVQPMTDEQSH